MPSYRGLSVLFKKGQTQRQKISTIDGASRDRSTATGILAVSGPVLACGSFWMPPAPGPQESTVVPTIYRNTSDAAQTFLPPVQAVADMIPGVGGIIKGAIGGMLNILQLVDVSQHRSRAVYYSCRTSSSQKYVQNKGDLETLRLRLHLLRHHIGNAPIAQTTIEETIRQRLLRYITHKKRGFTNTSLSVHCKRNNYNWKEWKNVSVDPPPSRKT